MMTIIKAQIVIYSKTRKAYEWFEGKFWPLKSGKLWELMQVLVRGGPFDFWLGGGGGGGGGLQDF